MAANPKKSPGKRVLMVLLIVLLCLCLVAGGLFAFVQLKLGQINRITPTEFTEEDFDADTSAPDTIDEIDWGDPGVATSVDGVVNILLVGQDTRVEGERARSDSMIVLSVNQNTKQLSMVSLMRDLYVQIPGYSNNKLNAAFQFGGFELLDQTIETNFGILIDYNVEVDFSGFKEIVDTVGGVDINLYQEEADYLNAGSDWGLTSGYNHLNGEQALAYARTRYVGRYDFERTQRQRTVIQAIYAQLRQQGWGELLQVYDSCAKCVSTDMTNGQILGIAFTAYSMGIDTINTFRLPEDDKYSDEIVNGMDVLVSTDWDELRESLREFLYGDPSAA